MREVIIQAVVISVMILILTGLWLYWEKQGHMTGEHNA